MNSSPIQQAAPVSKKTNKIWIIVVVVLLILCCLCLIIGGVAGYFYFQNNSSEIGEVFDTFAQPPQSNEIKAGEEIRNEVGGYSFKTIPNYKLITFSEEMGILSLDHKDKIITEIGDGPTIQLVGGVNWKPFTLEEYAMNGNEISKEHYKATSSEAQEVTVAGLKGLTFDYDYEIPEIGKLKSREIYILVNPNQLFYIECRSRIADWDQMLIDYEAVTNSVTFFEPEPKN